MCSHSPNDFDDKVTTDGTPYTISSKDDSYFRYTAGNIAVNATSLQNPNYFATSSEIVNGEAKYDVVEELLKLQKDVTMFRGDNAESFLETLLSDITVDVDKTNISYKNYYNLQTAVANQRTSVSGVDEDEEALNLIKFQNAYNLEFDQVHRFLVFIHTGYRGTLCRDRGRQVRIIIGTCCCLVHVNRHI